MPLDAPSFQPGLGHPDLRSSLARGFRRMLGAVPRPRRHRGHLRSFLFRVQQRPLPADALPPATLAAAPAPDPVETLALALDRLGPAAVRACAYGVGVRVAVPDEATAELFRAALLKTQQRRVTDRLIEVVVEKG